MMKDNIKKAATFSFVGKPNNGKSSMISALMMDDRIKISPIVGTTKVSTQYSYKYKNTSICNFYDTPGFEESKLLWSYIRKRELNKIYGNNIFYDFIEEYKNEESFKKDIEILEAILKSNYIIFVINISKDYSKNTFASELSIMKYLSSTKPVLILFNKIGENDYSKEWKIELLKYKLTNTYTFNPLNGTHKDIINMYKRLYAIDSSIEGDKEITNILNNHQSHFDNNINLSAKIITDTIYDMLVLEHKTSRYNKKEEEEKKFLYKMTKIEKECQKKINKIWGYHEVIIDDLRTEIGTKDSLKLKLSKNEKAISSAILAAVAVGTVTGVVSGGLGAPAGGGIGFIIGGMMGYLSDGKLMDVKQLNNDAIYSVSKKDIDFTIIMITRTLEYSKKIINHGHANRDKILINETRKYDFQRKDLTIISNIHKSFTLDKDTFDNKKILKDSICQILNMLIEN